MAQLLAPLKDFLASGQNAVHGGDRAVVDALVEQASIDFGGCLIGEARLLQKVQLCLTFGSAKGAVRLRQVAAGPVASPDASVGDRRWRATGSEPRSGGEIARRHQRNDGIGHDASSLSDVAGGSPNKAAAFFGWG
jgi:hypothetical protein